MATRKFNPADLGHGTYQIPDVGLVVNGKVFDGHDDKAVSAYHEQDHKGVEQSVEVLAERDAVIQETVTAPASDDVKE
jgi:hypothetical protein